jgi:hypothetical protein
VQIQYQNPKSLTPNERNSRTHTDEQVEQIVTSIQEFGFIKPIIVDEANTILAGHGAWRAAQRLKMTEVPTITKDGLSDKQKRAYLIADNKIALNSGWNNELLKLEMNELREADFGVDMLGFSNIELLAFFGDTVEDPRAEWDDGMPSYKNDGFVAFRTLYVHFKTQEAVDEFCALIDQEITDKTKFVWYPAEARDKTTGEHYVDAS